MTVYVTSENLVVENRLDSLLARQCLAAGVTEGQLARLQEIANLSWIRKAARKDVLVTTVDSAFQEVGIGAGVRLRVLRLLLEYESEETVAGRRGSWFVNNVPIVNIFWDLLFDQAPSVDQIKDLLNVIIIITAFSCGTAAGVYSATSFDEIQNAILRFSMPNDVSWSFCSKVKDVSRLIEPSRSRCMAIVRPDGTFVNRYTIDNSWTGPYAIGLIDSFPYTANMAFGSLTTSLFLSFLMFLFITNTEWGSSIPNGNASAFEAWWRWSRWIVAVIMGAFVLGFYYLTYAFLCVVFMKFPSSTIEQYDDWNSRSDNLSTSLRSAGLFGYVILIFIIVLLFNMSMGLREKSAALNSLHKQHQRSLKHSDSH